MENRTAEMVNGQNYWIYTGIEEGVYCGPDENNNPIFKINGAVAMMIPPAGD